jgi:hypothetical protein
VTERRIVYHDADGVRRTMILDDDAPHRVVVHTEQALDEILGGIARDRELEAANDNHSPNRLVARIPVEVFERMILEGWGPDDEAKWLNSPEAAPFRIWRGRV